MTIDHALTIRRARPGDAAALRRLAELDSSRPPAGEALLAELDGRPVAAIELASERVIADPFRPTAEVVELLRLRARRLGAAAGPASPAPGLYRNAEPRATRLS